MSSGARFWRNVAIIAGAHVLFVIAFVRWGGATKPDAQQQQITWLSGANAASSVAAEMSAGASREHTRPPPQEHEQPEAEEQPTIAPGKSEIQLPTPTPAPTPRPIVKTVPTAPPKPSATAKPSPKPTPKKSLITKATPKPKPKATPADDDEPDFDAAREAIATLSSASSGGGGSAHSAGTTKAETQWYGRMLHDRFHNAWDQPTSVVATGAKMSALVKARIEKDGRVSRFEIVKPSGSFVLDESVRAVAGRVTQVDPLPSGVGNGEHYDVTINFELNPEE